MRAFTSSLSAFLSIVLLAAPNVTGADQAASAALGGEKVLRAGIIGLDTSHVIAFTRLLNDPNAAPEVAGVKVVAAFPGGSADFPPSRDRVEKFTQDIRAMGVEIVPSIPALLEKVDVVLLESVDGRVHLEQVKPVFAAGKPVFIDKPLGGSLAQAVAIAALGEKHDAKWFSSSSLRYGPELARAKTDGKLGKIVGATTWGPCEIQPTHPDLFWYGIHGVEMLYAAMGAGCETVTRVHTDGADVVTGVWEDGRLGTYRGVRAGKSGFGAAVFGEKGSTAFVETSDYKPLMAEIVKFFKTGKPPVSPAETVELFAFMEAADESKRQGGRPVAIEAVLAKARQEARTPAARWYKGNLHTHSFWSDGDDFPEMISDWYKSRGYDFLAISDHNTIHAGEKWVKLGDLKKKNAEVALEKYRARFGEKVQTRGTAADQTLEIRLQPLETYRHWLEEPGSFLLIQSEEISDKFEKKPIHLNATNLGEQIKPAGGNSVREVIENNLRAVKEQSRRLNRPILPHLNHPNFGWGVSAEDLAHAVEENFFEVYNGHPGVRQLGDEEHMSIERMWDVCNTIRLAQLGAPPLMGLGTDDSHHYHVGGPNRSAPGRAWVMVRADALTPEALIGAMEAGDFYASSGVTLKDARYAPETKTLTVQIQPEGDETFTTAFIGTPRDFATAAGGAPGEDENPLTSDRVGVTFASVRGTSASYRLTGRELYVRALVTSDAPHPNPSLKGQKKQAWTQPVGWRL